MRARTPPNPLSTPLPQALRPPRNVARQAILWSLWTLPALLALLAGQAGMGWELVTLLAIILAPTATIAARRRGRVVPAMALAAGSVLLSGTTHVALSPLGAAALPLATLALVACLCDPRAIGASCAILLAPLLPRHMAGDPTAAWLAAALALSAAAAVLAQHGARRACRRALILPPAASAPGTPAWSVPCMAHP